MPTEPYIAHPTVEPAPRPPDDYFHLEANPERFAAAARGLQELGKGITQADDNWQEMRKDAALNAALKESEAAVEEYGKLRGADAVAAEQKYRQTVDQIFQQHGANLPPKWRTEFDTIGRRYQYGVLNGKMSTHAITQGLEVTNQTNKATMERAGDQASNNYNNPDEESLDKNRPIPSARQLARQGALKAVQANGNAGVPEIVDEAIKNADAYFYSRTATAKYENNAPDGYDYVKKHINEMGAEGTNLLLKFKERAQKQQDDAAADVRIKLFQTNDPEAQRRILNENKNRLNPTDLENFEKNIPGGAAPTSNVLPFRPSAAIQPGESPADYAARMLNEPTQKPAAQSNAPLPGESPSDQAARAAKQGLETLKAKTPLPRQPNESPGDWKKRNSSQNFSPVQNFSGAKQTTENAPGQQAIATALGYAPTMGGYANKLGGLEPGEKPPAPGITDREAVSRAITDAPITPGAVTDLSAVSGLRPGHRMESVNGMIIHHSGGGGTVQGVIDTLKQRGLSAQFVIDRNGKTYQLIPDGTEAHHIMNGWGPKGEGKSNRNMQGVEVIAQDNRDVTPVQIKAVQALVARQAHKYGYNPATSVFGHGEVNPGHKEADEGMSSVSVIRGQVQQASQ